jgi:hypothetical protein
MTADGQKLIPGQDYYVALSSPSVSGEYQVLWLNSRSFIKPSGRKKFEKTDLSNTVLILDTGFSEYNNPRLYKARAVIVATAAPMSWDVSDGSATGTCPVVTVSREKLPQGCSRIGLNIESEFRKDYPTQNVAGYLEGTSRPDSFLVFIAHYDHLGRMGRDTYFPGAHDNASGCAMLLDLARHYAMPENRPAYSVAFIFLSAEEAGLLGSAYYVNQPLFPLKKIKFLLNLDMESTGSDGIKVVNGSVFTEDFDRLVRINAEKKYLSKVSPRGEAANSDHYMFYKKGVKCFYIYTLGTEWKHYHTPEDVSDGLPMTRYTELFRLVTDFFGEMNP